jgi:hypothetical protein
VTRRFAPIGFPQNSRRYLLAVLAAAWMGLLPARAPAQPLQEPVHRRVLLLADKPGGPFMERIKAEIASLGLEVVMRAPVGPIEADARAEHAAAAIRMLSSHTGVEVWMADETSGRSLLRQVIADETPGGPDQNVVALQTAELLRTSFFPKSDRSLTPPHPVRPPTGLVDEAAPPRPSGESGAQAGVGFLYSAGSASAAWQAWLSLQHLWGRHFGVALDVSAPIHRGTMSGPEGSADVGAVVVGGEFLARFGAKHERVFLTTGLGTALVFLLAKGHPSQEGRAQLTGTSSAACTGLGYLRIALGWKPSGWLGLGVGGLVGSTIAKFHIRFAGNDAGTWGGPLFAAGLFGEVDWH